MCVFRYARLNEWENFAVYYDKVFGLYSQLPASIHSISSVTVFLECSVLLAKKELATPGQKACKRTLKVFNAIIQILKQNRSQIAKTVHILYFLI